MIQSKQDLKLYLSKDKQSLGKKAGRKGPSLFGEEVWKFQIALRKLEYYTNMPPTPLRRLMKLFWRGMHKRYGLKLGFSIPVNVFGPGLRINHYGLLVVHPNARIGAFCDIHQGVNIGQSLTGDEVPTIGDNVFIGPGAKLFGKIYIADKIAIGANAVVNTSFPEEGISIGGIPARKIGDKGNLFVLC